MGKIKILIVDDSRTKRSLYAELLKKEGYIVAEAQDGLDGLKKARTESPDVIISDLEMPQMSGFEMVKILKKEEATKYIPVVCISTTYKDIESKLRALTDSGAEEFFYMPENMGELLVKLRVVLRIRAIYLELLEKNRLLKQFNDISVGRELKMVELKKKVVKLEEELKKYRDQR